MSNHRETIMVIKDSLFELVMGGTDFRKAVNMLHHIDGYAKDDIIQAVKELQQEAGIDNGTEED